MNTLFESLTHPALLNLGAWLLHFTWQGALITLFLALLLHLFRGASSEIRYVTCWVALGLMVLLPGLTTFHSLSDQVLNTALPGTPDLSAPFASQRFPGATWVTGNSDKLQQPIIPQTLNSLANLRPYLALVWMLGVVVFAFRLQLGIHRTSRLLSSGAVNLQFSRLMVRLRDQLNIRRNVVVKSSPQIDQPVLIGWLRPVILLPASILGGMPLNQLEAILAHELAHVKRHDYLFSVVQSLMETLFFFHPAVWWISHQIRIEREYCCDALAVATLSNKKVYLQTLAALEARRIKPDMPALLLSINDGSLLDRVKRITSPSNHYTTIKPRTTIMGIALFVCLSIFATSGINTPFSAQQIQQINNSPQVAKDDGKSNKNKEIELALEVEVRPTMEAAPEVTLSPAIEQDLEVTPSSPVEAIHPDEQSGRPLDAPSLHPLKTNARVTSGFGERFHPILNVKKMHEGIDFVAATGTPVYATADGTVKRVTQNKNYGMYILILHAGGYETLYSSLSVQDVQTGVIVKKGDKIGESGSSGLSTAPHLHYEVRLHGKAVDPAGYLPEQ